MFCRRISLPFLFALAFLVPAVGLVDSCSGQTVLRIEKHFTGQKFRYDKVGSRIFHRPVGDEVSATGYGDNDADACKDGYYNLKKLVMPDPSNNEYLVVNSSDGCCELVKELCPGAPNPLLSTSATGSNCGKYLVKVSCVDCATGGLIYTESTTDHPHIEARRMRRDFRKFLADYCLKCNGRIHTKITKNCDCGCN